MRHACVPSFAAHGSIFLQRINHENGSSVPLNLGNLNNCSGSVTEPNFSSMEATHRTNLARVNFSSPVSMPRRNAWWKRLNTKLSPAQEMGTRLLLNYYGIGTKMTRDNNPRPHEREGALPSQRIQEPKPLSKLNHT
jgi:hypothetical protein